MTESTIAAADAYALTKMRRRSARRLMQSLTLCCVLAGAGLAADQFYTGGLQAFLDRPAGVGATPPEQAATEPVPAAVIVDPGAVGRHTAPRGHAERR